MSSSNDSGDDSLDKVRQAVADGVELPVRSDHEWVGDFAAEITALGVEKFAKGIGSIELTSMELWGHMGVFPLTPDATKPNAGAPHWQTWPTPDALDTPFQTLAEATIDANREMQIALKGSDFKEGVASFVEKRPPRFTGK